MLLYVVQHEYNLVFVLAPQQLVIQEESVTYPDGIIVSELKNFGYESTRNGTRYEAAYGHDDCVMALSLAVKCFDEYGHAGWGVW